jgi:uncharacterized protein YndB with AHSA1/START domain
MKRTFAAIAAVLAMSGVAHAEVTDKSSAGFQVVQKVTIKAPTAQVYAALLQVGRWWSPDHSYTHDSANLTMDIAKGCFCEKLPKGEVRHLEIIAHDGEFSLILSGAMGPLVTTAAAGHMAFALKYAASGTELTLTYDVGGYAKGGFEPWAAPVDGVLGEQLGRLKSYVETGKPTS